MSSEPPRRNPYWKAVDYVNHGKRRESRKTTWITENYVIHVGPVGDYEGIGIVLEKNYVIHVKLRDSRKTTWFIKNSLITFSLKDIAPIFGYIFYSRNWYFWHSWEARPKLRNNWLELGSNVVCFMCRFNSFSPGQKAIHVGITLVFMKTPGFRPSPTKLQQSWVIRMGQLLTRIKMTWIRRRTNVSDDCTTLRLLKRLQLHYFRKFWHGLILLHCASTITHFCGGTLGFGFIITILNHTQWDTFESPIISCREESFVVTRFSILKFALVIKHPCFGFVLWCGQAFYFVLPSEGAAIDGGQGKTSVFWEPAATKNIHTHTYKDLITSKSFCKLGREFHLSLFAACRAVIWVCNSDWIFDFSFVKSSIIDASLVFDSMTTLCRSVSHCTSNERILSSYDRTVSASYEGSVYEPSSEHCDNNIGDDSRTLLPFSWVVLCHYLSWWWCPPSQH